LSHKNPDARCVAVLSGIPLGPIMPSETADGLALVPSLPRRYPTQYFDPKLPDWVPLYVGSCRVKHRCRPYWEEGDYV